MQTTSPQNSSTSRLFSKNVPLFLSGLAFLFIVLGFGTMFLLQGMAGTQRFDSRSAASVASGLVTLNSSFQDSSTTQPDGNIQLKVNTHGVQISSLQVVFNIVTNATDTLTMQTNGANGLIAQSQEIEKTQDGFLVMVRVVPSQGASFSSNQDTVFATLQFRPTRAGSLALSFDEGNSTALVSGTNPPRDELKTIAAFSYNTAGIGTTVTPLNDNGQDDLFFDAPKMSIRFFKTDGSNQEVLQRNLQRDTYYRTEIHYQIQNRAKTQAEDRRSITVQYYHNGPSVGSKTLTYANVTQQRDGWSDTFTDNFYFHPTEQFTLKLDTTNVIRESDEGNNTWTFSVATDYGRACNQSCNSNAECGSNLRCYKNQCRLVTNVSSDACSLPSNSGLQRGCNQYCADTTECASGYTCFYNQCRRPENPDSASCKILTQTSAQQIAKSCNTACSSNRDCGVNLRCYNGACRLASNVSSYSCSPHTAKTVSSMYQTGQKGEEIDLPSSETQSTSSAKPATTSARPSATASAGIIVATGAGVIIPQSPEPYTQPQTQTGGFKVPSFAFPSFALPQIGGIGSSLGMVAIAAGVLILVLAIVSLILEQFRHKPTQQRPVIVNQASAPMSTGEQRVAERIAALKNTPVTPPMPAPKPVAVAPAPITSAAPTQAPSTPPPSSILQKSSAPSMLQKMKAGRLDQNLSQQPVQPTQVQTAAPTPQPTQFQSATQGTIQVTPPAPKPPQA